jgi:sialate O-acetylesterase
MKQLLLLVFVCAAPFCRAQIKLPQIVRDSMILQRDTKVKMWGWASPSEKVTVTFNNKKYKATATVEGNWNIMLPPTKAGGPYQITIAGKNTITLKEILFGDVWFCSGQSNMVHQLNIHDVTYAKEIAEANNSHIRQFWVPNITNMQAAQNNLPFGYWKPAVGEDVRPFSAVAYFFAKKLFEKYKVPIGIINASWGGTPIEAWTSEEGLKDFSTIINTVQKNKDTAYTNSFNRRPVNNNRPPQPADAGLSAEKKWYDETYTPKGWKKINIPGYWEDQGIKDLNGVVWYRKEVDVPATMLGKPAKVFLGRIIDADELYINGKRIGNTGYQYPQRRYAVANDVLRAGKNVFVIRVRNDAGKGGFVPDKPYCIFSGNDTVDLKGTWQYKVGEVFIPGTGSIVGGIAAHLQPAALFNAMVAPITNYTVKGFCWYQGESNAGKPSEYATLLPALINDWRNKWQLGNLPFLNVQLPGFMDYNYTPSESNWAVLRESQLKALALPNTAMVVAIDLGEWNDIHPDNKKDVGERLAVAAMKLAYGENIVHSGPLYQSHTIEGNKIIISFSNTGSGLTTNDGEPPAEFAIAGADKKFVWAKTKIEGDKIIIWCDAIANPVYIRYAWADNPVNPNVYNKEGLPASPFRTDN